MTELELKSLEMEVAINCPIDRAKFINAALREKQEREKNAPLTLEDLRGMDGEPVWVTPLGFWALVIATPGNRIKLICNDGETVWADKEIELVGPVYRRPPE